MEIYQSREPGRGPRRSEPQPCTATCDELRRGLLRAELAGEISEFHALSFQAVLAMSENSDCVDEYLEMAEAIATSERELDIVAGIRTTCHRMEHPITRCPPRERQGLPRALRHTLLCALATSAPPLTTARRRRPPRGSGPRSGEASASREC